MKKVLLPGIIMIISLAAFAQSGTLDNTFDGDGIKLIAIDSLYDVGSNVAIQNDGKILVSGYFSIDTFNAPEDYFLLRMNADGSFDSTFGVSGIVKTDVSGFHDRSNDMLIQPDGKIILAGTSTDIGSYHNCSMVRYKINGQIDSSFGNNGIILIDLSYSDEDGFTSIALQPDGKVVAAGYSNEGIPYNSDFVMILMRFSSNGLPDSSFGNNGLVKFDCEPLSETDIANSILLQADGKIIIGGYVENFTAIARFNTDGSPDLQFGDFGSVVMDIPGGNSDHGNSLALQEDGMILLAGSSYSFNYTNLSIIRIDSTGMLDNTFGTNGTVITDVGSGSDVIFKILVQPDGKILAAGTTGVLNSHNILVARYNTSGELDSTFGTNGISITDLGSEYDLAYDMALQQNGKILVTGITTNGFNGVVPDIVVLRFIGDIATDEDILVSDGTNKLSIYPNPVSSTAFIQFSLSYSSEVKIELFDLQGRKIKTIAEGNFEAGSHELILKKENIRDGVYLLQLQSGAGIHTQKLIIQSL